jgi:adenylyl-sulfate kinase
MAEAAFRPNTVYLLRQGTQTVLCEAAQDPACLDLGTLEERPAEGLRLNEIGTVELETHRPIFCDLFADNRATGSFILIDPISNHTVGAGMIVAADGGNAGKTIVGLKGRGVTVWFTGLSGAGKSTLCQAVAKRLNMMGVRHELLDGDTIRQHLCKDLGFSKFDREENIRRVGFVADLLTRNGVVVLAAAISPYRSIREEVRQRIRDFVEVYVNAPPDFCEQRDSKGLYRREREGLLPQFTGVDDPYEAPEDPEVECRTDRETLEESVEKVVRAIESKIF